MHEILEAGIAFILWIQQYQTPASYHFWEIYTNFGGRYYLFMIPALLWCVDYRTGLRTIAIFIAALVVNTVLKEWWSEPRPFEFDSRVFSDGEIGYGMPSGHAQLAVVFWGVIANWVGRPAFSWLAVAIVFLMGLSRVVLGVHFPSDVLVGWALGALMLWLYLRYRTGLEDWVDSYPLGGQVGWALTAAAVVIVFNVLVPGVQSPMIVGAAGVIAGAGVGAAVGLRALSFDGRGPIWKRALRFVVGMLVLLPLVGLMQRIGVPEGGADVVVLAADLALLGFWMTFGAPWLFEKLRLSGASRA